MTRNRMRAAGAAAGLGIRAAAIALLLGLCAGESSAYERYTHSAITAEAARRSVVADPALLTRLGIADIDRKDALGARYYDIHGNINDERMADDARFPPINFENDLVEPIENRTFSATGWLMRGAIREDDVPWDISEPDQENNPQDDPVLNTYRVFHHFFDPYHNEALSTIACVAVGYCQRSPDWALGSTDAFAVPPPVNGNRANHFTIADATEAMWRALVGKRFADNGPITSSGGAADQATRTAYWATLFRALGDVVHHMQDMAQPQHTRNDRHSGKFCLLDDAVCLGGHSSFYEKYIDARARRDVAFRVGQSGPQGNGVSLPALNYGAYPIPRFNRYSDFWSTGVGPTSLSGQGIADYSSRGFYSAGTNISSTAGQRFPSPPPDGSGLADLTLQGSAARNIVGDSLPGSITFKVGTVTDTLAAAETVPDVRLATKGAFDQFLNANGKPDSVALNYYNYDDQAALLVPRAVAYSAGLINHFFRGQMEISLPTEGVYAIVDHATVSVSAPATDFKGFSKIKLKLRNSSPPPVGGSTPEGMGGGTLVAVVKFRRNTCYSNDLKAQPGGPSFHADCRAAAEEIVASQPLTKPVPTEDTPFEFVFTNAVPINATDVYLQVVYRGQLGAEADAMVVATKDISEPTFFTYQNDSDYIHLGAHVYTRDDINANKNGALGLVQPQSCIDYDAVPPKLRDTCLTQAPWDVGVVFGPPGAPGSLTVSVQNLPPLRYIRLAFLTDNTGDAILSQLGSNSCYPHDAFEVSSVEWQTTFNPATGGDDTIEPEFEPLRGIFGWYQTGCVLNGDNSTPGTPDDRDETMGALASDPGPYAVPAIAF